MKEFWQDCEKHESKAERAVAQKLEHKMKLLMQHYRISDYKNMSALAWALAFEHVPGFKIVPAMKTKKGRKRKWDGHRLQELFETVHMLKSKHGLKDKQALKFMANNERYAAIWGPTQSHKGSKQQWIETLESRLQDAKRYVRRIATLKTLGEEDDEEALRAKFRKW